MLDRTIHFSLSGAHLDRIVGIRKGRFQFLVARRETEAGDALLGIFVRGRNPRHAQLGLLLADLCSAWPQEHAHQPQEERAEPKGRPRPFSHFDLAPFPRSVIHAAISLLFSSSSFPRRPVFILGIFSVTFRLTSHVSGIGDADHTMRETRERDGRREAIFRFFGLFLVLVLCLFFSLDSRRSPPSPSSSRHPP